MAKHKKNKPQAFDPSAYRAGVHRHPTLPSCGAKITVRLLPIEEVQMLLKQHEDAVAHVAELLEQNGTLDDAVLMDETSDNVAFLTFTRRLVCEASVAPIIVMEPTLAPDRLCVRDLKGEDLAAIISEALPPEVSEAARIMREMSKMGLRGTVTRRGETEDEEWERKTRENEAVAAMFTHPDVIHHMAGKGQA